METRPGEKKPVIRTFMVRVWIIDWIYESYIVISLVPILPELEVYRK